MTRKKRLGRGLESLLNSTIEHSTESVAVVDQFVAPVEPKSSNPQNNDIVDLSVYEIENNPFQPRRVFSESEIGSLCESLKEHDLMQPIVVRVVDGRYQLISLSLIHI